MGIGGVKTVRPPQNAAGHDRHVPGPQATHYVYPRRPTPSSSTAPSPTAERERGGGSKYGHRGLFLDIPLRRLVGKAPKQRLSSHRHQRLLPLYVVSSGYPQGRTDGARRPEEHVGIDVRACAA